VRFHLSTVDDTRAFGQRLGGLLRAGDLVILDGPLGAGKTALAQGIGAGLGVRGAVTSPTFVVSRIHPPDPERGGTVALVHVDAYRLGGMAEVDDLDLDADLDRAVTVVEWGGGKVEQLAEAHLHAGLDRRDDDVRVVTLTPHGADWADRLSVLAASSEPVGGQFPSTA
jgi:tRNA threonylcarbamoyladenosine biosynthesis protein TsaE